MRVVESLIDNTRRSKEGDVAEERSPNVIVGPGPVRKPAGDEADDCGNPEDEDQEEPAQRAIGCRSDSTLGGDQDRERAHHDGRRPVEGRTLESGNVLMQLTEPQLEKVA